MDPQQETAWDLRWTMFGVAVRVTPWFWLASAFMGQNLLRAGLEYLLAWIACVFVSVLIHELGHVVMGRYFGCRGHIILVAFGGLAVGSNRMSNRWQRIAVSLAGPGAGFLFLAAVLGVVALRNFDDFLFLTWDAASLVGIDLPITFGPLRLNQFARFVLMQLVFINLLWGLINLLPIWPLDGGMVCRELCEMKLGGKGLLLSLQISVGAAAFFTFAALMACLDRPILPIPLKSVFVVIMFGLFAFQSYQLLVQAQNERRWVDDRWQNYDD